MAEPSPSAEQFPYYDHDVDFDELARRDPAFAAISTEAKKNGFIDFQNPQIVQQLTKSLLKSDFGLTLSLPDDRLCPPVPVRWNYVRWIQDLLDTTREDFNSSPVSKAVGLDIGVGATCIYPLLACSTRSGWRMLGTEIDSSSLSYANQNVKSNDLASRIRLTHVSDPAAPLLHVLSTFPSDMDLDFVMTNPPFYSSREDMLAARGAKLFPPSAVCAGAENEMICEGGDVGFVSRLIDESLAPETRNHVRWFSAMMGRLASLQQVVAKIKAAGITNYAVTCLQAGHRTRRWAVAWSFEDLRPRDDVVRHGELVRAVLPASTAYTLRVKGRKERELGIQVDEVVGQLDVKWKWRPNGLMGVMWAAENVWSRAARRKRKFQDEQQEEKTDAEKKGQTGEENEQSQDEDAMVLVVKISCKDQEVHVRWLRGLDVLVFTSFCGMLKRSLTIDM